MQSIDDAKAALREWMTRAVPESEQAECSRLVARLVAQFVAAVVREERAKAAQLRSATEGSVSSFTDMVADRLARRRQWTQGGPR